MESTLVKQYIENRTFSFFSNQLEMEAYAKTNKIPIISRDSLDLLISIIKIKKPKKILEFGTAIGYSAIAMAIAAGEDSSVITFERDEIRYLEAIQNIEKSELKNRIKVYHSDIFDSKDLLQNENFDFVFIDAAKGQYRLFFDLIFEQLDDGGVIISDNILHKGLVLAEDASQVDRKRRTIYRRMTDYVNFLKEDNEKFFTSLIPIGDGIAITYKKERTLDE